jgi:hypothetical protein
MSTRRGDKQRVRREERGFGQERELESTFRQRCVEYI